MDFEMDFDFKQREVLVPKTKCLVATYLVKAI